MLCPVCGGDTKIYDSRSKRFTVRRRRECLECGYRNKTYELSFEMISEMLEGKVPTHILDRITNTFKHILEDEADMDKRVKRKKLTPFKVKQIRKRYDDGDKIAQLAKEFDVTIWAVSNVVYRRTWKHVD